MFRGFVFERLGKLVGPNPLAKIATVLVSSTWFAAVHYVEQGVEGDAAYDSTAIALISGNLESTIAHLVFK